MKMLRPATPLKLRMYVYMAVPMCVCVWLLVWPPTQFQLNDTTITNAIKHFIYPTCVWLYVYPCVCLHVCMCVFVFYFENYFWLNKRCKFLAVSPVWLLVSGHLRHIVIAIWLLAIFGAKFFYYIQIKLLHSLPTSPLPEIWIKNLLLQATCGCVRVCVCVWFIVLH